MAYRKNPKMAGSGLLACIPQTGRCPNNCPDCFFQTGRSYLSPALENNLPNMPSVELAQRNIVRVNDWNDSNVDRAKVLEMTKQYPFKFYNTISPDNLKGYNAPVVLTINPHPITDTSFMKIRHMPKNLMFVRFRVNTWNLDVAHKAIRYYTLKGVPVVLTFMAYFSTPIKQGHEFNYVHRVRTINGYQAITTNAWEEVMSPYKYNPYVYSCGKIEGEIGTTKCARCGNCVREYFVALKRMEI